MLRHMNPTDLASLRLETPRLILRPPRMEDFDAWAHFSRMKSPRNHRRPAAAAPPPGGRSCACAVLAHDGHRDVLGHRESQRQWVGRLGPWFPEGWPEPEVGWGIAREHWGKGYASEGAAAAMDYAFDVLGWSEVIHCIDEDKLASQGVAKRLGS